MKRNLQFIISASAVSVLSFAALAQDSPNPKTDRPDYTRDGIAGTRDTRRDTRRTDRLNGAARASDIIGMTVKNYQDEKLGKVNDLAVDVESGRIVQVILSTGGFLGVGDTLTAVPPGALHHDVAMKVLHLDADKEKLKNGPKFETSKWAECCDSNHLATVYRYYGKESDFGFIRQRDAVAGEQRNTNNQQLAVGKRYDDAVPNTNSNRNVAGEWEVVRVPDRDQFTIPTSRLSHVQKASTLIGMQVHNLQDEKLGKVENILLDLPSGRVVAVVVSSGGFLGIGDELSSVPAPAIRFNAERGILQLDASKATLASAPHFKADQWPAFDEPSYAEGVYRAYKVEPYFTTNLTTEADSSGRYVRDRDSRKTTTTDADNTERNIRDRDQRTVTPLDQGNSKADVAITAQIRKEIIAGKEMSVNARNVKIITKDGHVTLRGPVDTDEEKRLIGDIADRAAQSANVENQLEVKTTPINKKN